MGNTLFCSHEQWQARLIPLSNGRPSLREFCSQCGITMDRSRLGFALPMVSDTDLLIPTYKYPGKTLGEIEKIDRSYLKWIILESKNSDRIKKSAARIYCGCPYYSPKNGEIYPASACYDATQAYDCIEKIREENKR